MTIPTAEIPRYLRDDATKIADIRPRKNTTYLNFDLPRGRSSETPEAISLYASPSARSYCEVWTYKDGICQICARKDIDEIYVDAEKHLMRAKKYLEIAEEYMETATRAKEHFDLNELNDKAGYLLKLAEMLQGFLVEYKRF